MVAETINKQHFYVFTGYFINFESNIIFNSMNKHYQSHLSRDEKLAPLLDSLEIIELKKRENVCVRLCASIMSQQLSTKVADVIYKRFLALYGGHEPTAAQILETDIETLRSIGLSYAKGNYVHHVARYIVENQVNDETLYAMTNEEIIAALTQIKGVGRWTVEMLLMFTMGREDVFAPDDLGIQQSMIKLYGLDTTNKKALKKTMENIALQWSPYRTYACLYLWKNKDK